LSEAGRSARARRSGSTGRRSERFALLFLMAKGYRPLARRFGGKGGEIDLIVRRGATVAFVEVKARSALVDAMGALTPRKRQLVEARIRQWLSRNPWAMNCHLRADALFIAPWRWPRHVPGVFDLVL
jgi:putative endonuclease